MTRPRSPGARTKRSSESLQVAEQLAVALGLALLGAAEHGEELADTGLRGRIVLQEQHGFADVLEVDVEVGAREAEQDR